LLRTIDAVEAEEQRCEGVERVGVHILRNALEVPARQIAKNAGIDDGPVVEKIRNGTGFFGFDARTKDYAELDDRGIIDPTKVVRVALQNAVAVAGVLLLAEATMIEVEEEPPPQPPEFG
jgi:chaperonin GroEL